MMGNEGNGTEQKVRMRRKLRGDVKAKTWKRKTACSMCLLIYIILELRTPAMPFGLLSFLAVRRESAQHMCSECAFCRS